MSRFGLIAASPLQGLRNEALFKFVQGKRCRVGKRANAVDHSQCLYDLLEIAPLPFKLCDYALERHSTSPREVGTAYHA